MTDMDRFSYFIGEMNEKYMERIDIDVLEATRESLIDEIRIK